MSPYGAGVFAYHRKTILNIGFQHILISVRRNEGLACREIVAEQGVKIRSVSAASTGVTAISRRVAGFMVVWDIMVGVFSPRPFERWSVYF